MILMSVSQSVWNFAGDFLINAGTDRLVGPVLFVDAFFLVVFFAIGSIFEHSELPHHEHALIGNIADPQVQWFAAAVARFSVNPQQDRLGVLV